MAKKTKAASPPPRHYPKPIRVLRGHLKLFVAAIAGLLLLSFLPGDWRISTRLLVGWDFASFIYLAIAVGIMRHFDIKRVQIRADEADEGGALILVLTIATALASLAAIVIELGSAHAAQSPNARHVAFVLAAVTVILSWTLIHTIFTFHYTHLFYRGPGERGHGLDFPGDPRPDYWDFMYFSFVVGMTFQVSDVQVTGKKMRRLVVAHGVVSFLFNVAIIALTVNIGANLI